MIKQINMDNDEGSKQKKTSNTIVDDGDSVSTVRVRCGFCYDSKLDQQLLDYNIYFLLPIGIIFWCLFLFI